MKSGDQSEPAARFEAIERTRYASIARQFGSEDTRDILLGQKWSIATPTIPPQSRAEMMDALDRVEQEMFGSVTPVDHDPSASAVREYERILAHFGAPPR